MYVAPGLKFGSLGYPMGRESRVSWGFLAGELAR